MRGLLGTLVFVLACADLRAQNDCVLKIDKDGIKVYTCHTDTSRFKSIVTELTLNTTMDSLALFVLDIPRYTQWQFKTMEAVVINEISTSEKIYRTQVDAPWPVADRDMVVHIRTSNDYDNKAMVITAVSEKGIVPDKAGFIRVPSSRAVWTIRQLDKHRLSIRYVMHIDPGGSVPAWLANWVCAHAPYESFRKLKELLER